MNRATPLLILGGLVLLSRVLARRGIQPHGSFLGVPYELRPPTMERVRASLWDPGDPRILTPTIFGWGFSVNFGAIARRLGLPA